MLPIFSISVRARTRWTTGSSTSIQSRLDDYWLDTIQLIFIIIPIRQANYSMSLYFLPFTPRGQDKYFAPVPRYLSPGFVRT